MLRPFPHSQWVARHHQAGAGASRAGRMRTRIGPWRGAWESVFCSFLSPVARLSKSLPTLLLLRSALRHSRRVHGPWVRQFPDVEPLSPGGDSVAGRSAAACAGAEGRGPVGPGVHRTPGGTTAAAHGGRGGAGARVPTPRRGAGGEKRPAVKLASRRPRRPSRASLPRPPALPAHPALLAGGERGFLAAVAVARPGSPEEAGESPPTAPSLLPARRCL